MAELVQVTEGYQKVLEENRKLYNEVQDLKGELNILHASRRLPLHLSMLCFADLHPAVQRVSGTSF